MQPFHDYTVYVYMPRCADGSYYVGSTRKSLDDRVGEHNSGVYAGYTSRRGPVELVWSQDSPTPSMRSPVSGSAKDGAAQRKRH